jgi:endoglucanase
VSIGQVGLVVLALAVTVTGCGDNDQRSSSTPASASPAARVSASAGTTAAATRFLTRYVTSDGRVIRHDQGSDIVSEGQAYAMLLAELVERPTLVRTIWSWTRAHLGRSDGLFAWHATASGRVDDPQPGTDADVLIAYALLRYRGTDQTALNSAGRRVAEAVLTNESVTLPDGSPLLVAGPWAKSTSSPIVDPSHLMPGVFVAIARLTGDRRWERAASAAIAAVAEVTDSGRRLPPDWARLSDARLIPIAAPGESVPVQYSFAAARLPIWFASACSPAAHSVAASWWRNILGSNGRSGPLALDLNGATINAADSPLMLIAGAAAATADGDMRAAHDLRTQADELALRSPTYYGDAWAALGAALLDRSIAPCDETNP